MAIKYFISHKNNNIAIYEVLDGQRSVLKKDGEETHLYDSKEFWSWWERKTVYKNEEVSFFVATDEESFEIPKNINITKKNVWKTKEIQEIQNAILSNQKIILFPEIEKMEYIKKGKSQKKSTLELRPDSIQAYFQNKTQITK